MSFQQGQGPRSHRLSRLGDAADGHHRGRADGEVLIADESTVLVEAQMQAEEVARRVAADPVHTEMALLEAMEVGQL